MLRNEWKGVILLLSKGALWLLCIMILLSLETWWEVKWKDRKPNKVDLKTQFQNTNSTPRKSWPSTEFQVHYSTFLANDSPLRRLSNFLIALLASPIARLISPNEVINRQFATEQVQVNNNDVIWFDHSRPFIFTKPNCITHWVNTQSILCPVWMMNDNENAINGGLSTICLSRGFSL